MNKSQNDFYTKKENRIIYILLSSTEKIFYINQCLRTSLKETYRHNIKGRREISKNFIDRILPERPCIFILENMNLTKSEAYNYILIWIKIFIEKGYQSFNNKKLIDLSEDLYFENQRIYEQRRTANLDILLSCKNCLIPIYNKTICKKYSQLNNETENKT